MKELKQCLRMKTHKILKDLTSKINNNLRQLLTGWKKQNYISESTYRQFYCSDVTFLGFTCCQKCNLLKDEFLKAVRLVLDSIYFVDNQLYKQTFGTPMNSLSSFPDCS